MVEFIIFFIDVFINEDNYHEIFPLCLQFLGLIGIYGIHLPSFSCLACLKKLHVVCFATKNDLTTN